MALSLHNKISIVQLCFFLPALAVAALLVWRHGFRRSAGWIYLVILALMRVIGSSMQLATINQPTNVGLATGAQVLQNVGLSPLLLVLLGLVTRAYSAMPEHSRPGVPNTRLLRILQLLIIVGLILSIVGGINTGNQISDDLANGTPLTYHVGSASKAGTALFIVGYVLLVVATLALLAHLRAVPAGERRLLLAVCAALPFVLVRLVFAILVTFDASSSNFRQFGGSTTAGYYQLGMGTVMEIVSAIIFAAVGLTLAPAAPERNRGSSASGQRFLAAPAAAGTAHTLSRYPRRQQRQRQQYETAYAPPEFEAEYPKQQVSAR